MSRAAASSIASGRPSRRRQISRTAASGSVANARSWNSAIASTAASGDTGYSRSPSIRSGARDVTSSRRFGQADRRPASGSAAPGSSCSRLSSTSRMRFSSMCAARPCWAPITCAMVGSISAVSVTAAKGTQKTPLPKSSTDFGRRLEREPRLARAAGARQRHDPVDADRIDELGRLAGPPDQRACLRGQVRGIERPQWRECAVADLEQLFRGAQVLEPMQPEIQSGIDVQGLDESLSDSTTCPPWPRRRSGRRGGRRCRRSPRWSRSASRCGCRSGRGRGRPQAGLAAAAWTASSARRKATKNASPWVSTSTPSWREASRRMRPMLGEQID